jgi:hypothetical protein
VQLTDTHAPLTIAHAGPFGGLLAMACTALMTTQANRPTARAALVKICIVHFSFG